MGDITSGIDSYFWITLGGLIFGSVGLFIRYAYKSKCSSVEICCVKIKRDIETELKEDLDNRTQSSNSPTNPSLSF